MDQLASLRSRIERTDEQIAALIGSRQALCGEVARLKRETDIPMMQPDRVQYVCEQYARRGAERGLDPDFMRRLASLVIDEMCRVETEIMESPAAGHVTPEH